MKTVIRTLLAACVTSLLFSMNALATGVGCIDITATTTAMTPADSGQIQFDPVSGFPSTAQEACISNKKEDVFLHNSGFVTFPMTGYAWNDNMGWLHFDWKLNGSYTKQRVGVDEDGYFFGYVWNDQIGWIHLDWWNNSSYQNGKKTKGAPHIDFTTGKPFKLVGYGWNDALGWVKFDDARTEWVPPVCIQILNTPFCLDIPEQPQCESLYTEPYLFIQHDLSKLKPFDITATTRPGDAASQKFTWTSTDSGAKFNGAAGPYVTSSKKVTYTPSSKSSATITLQPSSGPLNNCKQSIIIRDPFQQTCRGKAVSYLPECDPDAPDGSKYCTADCKFKPKPTEGPVPEFCGDRKINGEEKCDKGFFGGFLSGTQWCTNTCEIINRPVVIPDVKAVSAPAPVMRTTAITVLPKAQSSEPSKQSYPWSPAAPFVPIKDVPPANPQTHKYDFCFCLKDTKGQCLKVNQNPVTSMKITLKYANTLLFDQGIENIRKLNDSKQRHAGKLGEAATVKFYQSDDSVNNKQRLAQALATKESELNSAKETLQVLEKRLKELLRELGGEGEREEGEREREREMEGEGRLEREGEQEEREEGEGKPKDERVVIMEQEIKQAKDTIAAIELEIASLKDQLAKTSQGGKKNLATLTDDGKGNYTAVLNLTSGNGEACLDVQSFMPTSGVNAYDENHNGVIDFGDYFYDGGNDVFKIKMNTITYDVDRGGIKTQFTYDFKKEDGYHHFRAPVELTRLDTDDGKDFIQAVVESPSRFLNYVSRVVPSDNALSHVPAEKDIKILLGVDRETKGQIFWYDTDTLEANLKNKSTAQNTPPDDTIPSAVQGVDLWTGLQQSASVLCNLGTFCDAYIKPFYQSPDKKSLKISNSTQVQLLSQFSFSSNIPNVGTKTLRYMSNQFPRGKQSSIANPLAEIRGTISSSTGVFTRREGQVIVTIGDLSTNTVRNTISANVSDIIRGSNVTKGNVPLTVECKQSNGKCIKGLNFTGAQQGTGYEALKNNAVIYAMSDVYIGKNGNDAFGKDTLTQDTTIIVTGKDVYIDGNIASDKRVGIIALAECDSSFNCKGGNVYLHPQVTNVHANIYADGSLFSYDGTKSNKDNNGVPRLFGSTRIELLSQAQLVIRGSISSQNTVGGSVGDTASGTYLLGDGTPTTDQKKAIPYDLNQLRYVQVKRVRENKTDKFVSDIKKAAQGLASDQTEAIYVFYVAPTRSLHGFQVDESVTTGGQVNN